VTPSGNVDLVRSIFEPWQRGDFSSVDWADPEIEFEIVDGTEPGSARGLEGMHEAWSAFLGAWVELRVEVEEFREGSDGRVLALTQNSGRGKTSGLELGQMKTQGANLFQIRDGKVIRLSVYWDQDQAVADLERGGG
jgi:ketosteroid isomerase-like protein